MTAQGRVTERNTRCVVVHSDESVSEALRMLADVLAGKVEPDAARDGRVASVVGLSYTCDFDPLPHGGTDGNTLIHTVVASVEEA